MNLIYPAKTGYVLTEIYYLPKKPCATPNKNHGLIEHHEITEIHPPHIHVQSPCELRKHYTTVINQPYSRYRDWS